MIRRNYLKSVGGAVLGSAALSGTAAADYDRIIDVVSDLGVDNTGQTAIDDDLDPYLRDGNLLQFPDGRYKIDQLVLYKRKNFGMVATGDATLVPGNYPSDDVWIGGGAVRNLRFEGFTLDTTGTGPGIGFSAYDGLLFKDITKVGAHETHKTAFGFEIWDKDGSGLIENLRATDGDIYNDRVGTTAIYTKTKGTLTFRRCKIAGWGDNGLYASDAKGPVQVEGGYYANNNISQVRLSSPGSYVRGAKIKVNKERGGEPNMRGVRVCDGPGPVDVVDCDINMKESQGGGGIVNAHDGGSVNVFNCRIHIGQDYTTVGSSGTRTAHGILIDNDSGVDGTSKQVIENTSVTGGGTYGSAIEFRRGNAHVRNSCINQSGERDGIEFAENSSSNSVESSTVCVPQAPLVRNGAEVATSDIRYDGVCDLPSGVTYNQHEPSAIRISDAPIPSTSSRLSRPVMGRSKDNETAIIYGNYLDGGMRSFVFDNFEKLVNDFVTNGAINFEVRMIPSSPDEELLVQTGLGVWDKEPEKFWPFFEYVFRNQGSIDYKSVAGVRSILKAVGVRNYGWIPWLAYNGDYSWIVDGDRKAAGSMTSWKDYPPLLTFEGDVAAPQYSYERGVKAWLNQRL